jgi:nitrate reductase gamma subunit
MSELLHFAEHRLQEAALVVMAIVYVSRLYWLTRFPAGKERQAPTGLGDTNSRKGFIYSWGNVAMPWAMESSRMKPFLYGQFVLFHLGVVAAIALSFVIPYAPGLLDSSLLVTVFRVTILAALLVGVARIIRRASDVYMRKISTPDDYFSLLLLTVWFFFAFLSVPNKSDAGEWHLLTYFVLTAFFLIYVPFSKISHYLYYPFTRYYLGKSLGRRGVFPLRRMRHPEAERS